jgi:hypothetical protein
MVEKVAVWSYQRQAWSCLEPAVKVTLCMLSMMSSWGKFKDIATNLVQTFLLQLTFQWPKAMPSVAAALLRYVHRNGSHKLYVPNAHER